MYVDIVISNVFNFNKFSSFANNLNLHFFLLYVKFVSRTAMWVHDRVNLNQLWILSSMRVVHGWIICVSLVRYVIYPLLRGVANPAVLYAHACIGRPSELFSCPRLFFFPHNYSSSYFLPLLRCLISFLLFSWASVLKNTLEWVPNFL